MKIISVLFLTLITIFTASAQLTVINILGQKTGTQVASGRYFLRLNSQLNKQSATEKSGTATAAAERSANIPAAGIDWVFDANGNLIIPTPIRFTGGVYAEGNNSTNGTGIYGTGKNYGVNGNSSNIGVYGSGANYGVYGSGATGMWGFGNTGVWGQGVSYGVSASGNTGVYGAGRAYGVYGTCDPSGWAGYFVGKMFVKDAIVFSDGQKLTSDVITLINELKLQNDSLKARISALEKK